MQGEGVAPRAPPSLAALPHRTVPAQRGMVNTQDVAGAGLRSGSGRGGALLWPKGTNVSLSQAGSSPLRSCTAENRGLPVKLQDLMTSRIGRLGAEPVD